MRLVCECSPTSSPAMAGHENGGCRFVSVLARVFSQWDAPSRSFWYRPAADLAVLVRALVRGLVRAVGRRPARLASRVQWQTGWPSATNADGSLWVANFGDGTVRRVDPVSRRVAATIAAGSGAITAAAVGRQIWVANYDGTV